LGGLLRREGRQNWLGAWIVLGEGLFGAFLRVADTYLLNAYADRDHLHIVLFSLLLGE